MWSDAEHPEFCHVSVAEFDGLGVTGRKQVNSTYPHYIFVTCKDADREQGAVMFIQKKRGMAASDSINISNFRKGAARQ